MTLEITPAQAQELKQALKDKANDKHYRKLHALLLRSQGMSLTAIGKEVGLVHQSVRNLITRYQKGGLTALFKENRGGRRRAYMTIEEEERFLNQQLERALKGEHVTVQSLFEAYQAEVGKSTTREGFYALLKRHGWRKVTPRPKHPKKADAKTIYASKNKIYIQEDKKAL
ncbi:transposase [Streptococcus criceti]|uniref:Winged helix-turn helix domain-containing protein n=2 Tax=Streptococcus criceti TaxID=1333 RepID=G5JSX9_STRCG|nr:hypothetical protein STRCR_2250 [Streptococcus criceti HS-6]BAO01169.1 transposase [Streptococcus criceti]BAO01174.1 transposase [Streptococcus criceti]BAO01179.1 transposase [Streptococcus criceti]SUN43498.1 transposase [Streptococcus criceti]